MLKFNKIMVYLDKFNLKYAKLNILQQKCHTNLYIIFNLYIYLVQSHSNFAVEYKLFLNGEISPIIYHNYLITWKLVNVFFLFCANFFLRSQLFSQF